MINAEHDKLGWQRMWESKAAGYDDLLKQVASLRRTEIIISYIGKQDRILEAGCGDGKFVFYLRSLGYDITGVDYVESVIETNKEIARQKHLNDDVFRMSDVRDLNDCKGEYDVYLSMGVIEHFERNEQRLIIESAHKCLRKNGRVVVSVPNLYCPWTITRWILTKVSANFPYQKNISRFRLRRMFEEHGFRTVRVFNAEVAKGVGMVLRVNQQCFKGIPNPVFYARQLLESLTRKRIKGLPNPLYCIRVIGVGLSALLETLLPIIGYNTYYAGEKTEQ